ncbi:IS256 family transposase [candidate division KSB1 bacterium]|nr:IS256 family transposase [candidate division KSB1 bacterium]
MNLQQQDNFFESIMEALISQGPDFFKETLKLMFNEAMKIERSEFLKAAPYERTTERQGHANGFKPKQYNTGLGKLSLSIPQVRGLKFYPGSMERGNRSERALKLAIAEMYVMGVSTRKVTKITEQLCGLEISSTQVSRLSKELDEILTEFRQRPLDAEYPYVYLDARYEKVRHGGIVRDIAVLIAIGVNKQTGKREILAVETSLSEAEVHWRKLLKGLSERGLRGVQLFISDDHAGLKAARKHVFPAVPWQRCQFHMQQNAQSYVPKVSMRQPIADSVRDIFNAHDTESALELTRKISEKYQESAPEFSQWLEENIEEGLAVFNFPKAHRRKIRTVNPLERVNKEIKRRTRVAGIFPNQESCLRLITAVLNEIHEGWIIGRAYLIFDD